MMTTLIQNLITILSAALGAFFAVSAAVSHRRLCALISFAAGALIATTFLHIVPEAANFLSSLSIVLALLSGYLLFYMVSRYVFHVCPACAASHFEERTASELKTFLILLVIALGFHIIMDGIAIAIGRELQDRVDFSILMTVTIHKFPEGLALCALLMKSGVKKTASFFATIGIEGLTLVGWVLGISLLKGLAASHFFYLVPVHIGGGFVYLALHALLNESREHSPRLIIVSFLTGILFIALTSFFPQ